MECVQELLRPFVNELGGVREELKVQHTRRQMAEERVPPQLEAPPEMRESPQTVDEEPQRGEPRPVTVESQAPVQRPWWRKVFAR
jgi:hypothetical protein